MEKAGALPTATGEDDSTPYRTGHWRASPTSTLSLALGIEAGAAYRPFPT